MRRGEESREREGNSWYNSVKKFINELMGNIKDRDLWRVIFGQLNQSKVL